MDVILSTVAASGGTILTATERLARELIRLYDLQRQADGCEVWESPVILSLSAWISRQLQWLRREADILSDGQQQHCWEQVLSTDSATAGRDLLQLPQTARRARKAHLLLEEYLADFTLHDADEDQLAFLRWRAVWRERAGREGWLDRGGALRLISAAVADGTLAVPRALVLAGFDDLVPAVEVLVRGLVERGCSVSRWEPAPSKGNCLTVHAAVEMSEEVRACACWARAQLSASPEMTIGIVVPQLPGYQSAIERIFRAEFDPVGCLGVDDGAGSFTLSLGTPLAHEGVVAAALRLLALADPLRIDDLGWLLRSPYLAGSQSERFARARADRELRRRGRISWPLAALGRALHRIPGVSGMAGIIDAVATARRGHRRDLPGNWSTRFGELLEACGWPGERSRHSREYQAVRHFRDLLRQLAALDRVSAPLTRSEAVALLQRRSVEMTFQPEGPESRVKVLGILEAAGFSFDAVWVLGLNEGVFPAVPRPNPFLPLSLQSRLRMPHADALREGEFAAVISRRLFTAAPTVILSWPGQGNGSPLRPSPLLRGLPAAELPQQSCVAPAFIINAVADLQQLPPDETAPPLVMRKPFAGGTGILKDQALCPFRAFAHYRLRARALDAPDVGLDDMARGSLIHTLLERFWNETGSQAGLLALTPEALTARVNDCAEQAVARLERERRCDIPVRQRQLELARLHTLAGAWLEEETRRTPFEILEIEKSHVIQVGHLSLKTRVDRIDRLADGHLAIIDYKTGKVDIRQWSDERLTEPQLPLYCVGTGADEVGAVLFATLRSKQRERGFRGLAATRGLWPEQEQVLQKLLVERGWHDFDELREFWRTTLTALGDDFAGGVAKVDPVRQRKTCAYCDLAPLCRIYENGPVSGNGEDSVDV